MYICTFFFFFTARYNTAISHESPVSRDNAAVARPRAVENRRIQQNRCSRVLSVEELCARERNNNKYARCNARTRRSRRYNNAVIIIIKKIYRKKNTRKKKNVGHRSRSPASRTMRAHCRRSGRAIRYASRDFGRKIAEQYCALRLCGTRNVMRCVKRRGRKKK